VRARCGAAVREVGVADEDHRSLHARGSRCGGRDLPLAEIAIHAKIFAFEETAPRRGRVHVDDVETFQGVTHPRRALIAFEQRRHLDLAHGELGREHELVVRAHRVAGEGRSQNVLVRGVRRLQHDDVRVGVADLARETITIQLLIEDVPREQPQAARLRARAVQP
jgi:hypothetical protein